MDDVVKGHPSISLFNVCVSFHIFWVINTMPASIPTTITSLNVIFLSKNSSTIFFIKMRREKFWLLPFYIFLFHFIQV